MTTGKQNAKAGWKHLGAEAAALLRQVCPGNSPALVANRKHFSCELEDGHEQMGHYKKQVAKGGRCAGDTIRDWFTAWVKDQASSSRGGNAQQRDREQEAEGWQTKSSRSTGTTRTSTATTGKTHGPQPNQAPQRHGRGDGGRRQDEEEREPWRDLKLADDTPLIDPTTGDGAPRLDPTATLEEAVGYCFCTTSEAEKLQAKFAMAASPVTLIMPHYGKKTKEAIELALKQDSENDGGTNDPAIKETTLNVIEPNSGKKRSVDVLLVHMDAALPLVPPAGRRRRDAACKCHA